LAVVERPSKRSENREALETYTPTERFVELVSIARTQVVGRSDQRAARQQ
jgi:hypothetical protein